MKKKELTTAEICCGMPKLKAYFAEMDKNIKKFGQTKEINFAVEALKEERKTLLKVLREMNIDDLRSVLYLHNINKVKPYKVARLLKEINDAFEELQRLAKTE